MLQFAFLAVSFGVLGGYLYLTAQLPRPEFGGPYGPGVFPFLVGIFGMAALAGAVAETVAERGREAETTGPTSRVGPIAAVAAWTSLYVFLLEPLGYVLSTIPFLLALLCYFNRGRWFANIAVAVGFSLGIYLLFTRGLQLAVPAGVLPI